MGLTVATDSVLVAATGFAPRVVSTGSGDAEETPLHDVALPPLARLGGVVVDSVGRPVPHAIVAFVPRSTSFSGWNVALDGYEGAFSDDLSSVGYRVESDGAGAFSVPVPENDATLRIASADGVWISPSADESAGRVQPRDRTYMLWDVVELRARFVDTESRQPVDVDSWSAELLPDGARVDGQDLVDPPADLPSGEARFVGALEPPATQAVLRVAAVAWGYAPLAPVDVVLRPRRQSGAVERTFEWVRIPAADWGRIHVEAEPGTTGDPRVSCVLRAAGSPPGVNEKLVHIGFDGSSGVDVDVPSGEYRLVPVAAHSKDSFVAHEGRLEAVVREFAPMSISVRRGARVRYVLRFGSEARLDIRWGARGPRRPAWLYVGPPQRVDPPGQRWPLVDFSPAPDRISVFVRDGYRGPIEVIGASGASHRIDVALGVGEVQSVDLGTR